MYFFFLNDYPELFIKGSQAAVAGGAEGRALLVAHQEGGAPGPRRR